MSWEDYKARGIPGRIEAALKGENPTVIVRMPSAFAVMGDSQFLPGYCLLVAYPIVADLNSLSPEDQLVYLRDTARLGRVLQEVTNCARVNYGTYGNHDPYLHTHIWARYTWEREARRQRPAWFYPAEERNAPEVQFDPVKHGDMQRKMAEGLERLLLTT